MRVLRGEVRGSGEESVRSIGCCTLGLSIPYVLLQDETLVCVMLRSRAYGCPLTSGGREAKHVSWSGSRQSPSEAIFEAFRPAAQIFPLSYIQCKQLAQENEL